MISASRVLPLLSQFTNIQAGYVYGSFAKGTARSDSDIDILLIVSSTDNIDYGSLHKRLSSLLHIDKLDLRLAVLGTTSPLYLYEVIKVGTLIYEKKINDHIPIERAILKYYFDSQHLRNIFNEYLSRRLKSNTYGKQRHTI